MEPCFNPGSSLSGCLFCALDVNHSVKEIIVVLHECKAPYLNTDMDKAVCFLIAFSYLYAFTDHTLASFWERKLMTTRHALGRVVLETVP